MNKKILIALAKTIADYRRTLGKNNANAKIAIFAQIELIKKVAPQFNSRFDAIKFEKACYQDE